MTGLIEHVHATPITNARAAQDTTSPSSTSIKKATTISPGQLDSRVGEFDVGEAFVLKKGRFRCQLLESVPVGECAPPRTSGGYPNPSLIAAGCTPAMTCKKYSNRRPAEKEEVARCLPATYGTTSGERDSGSCVSGSSLFAVCRKSGRTREQVQRKAVCRRVRKNGTLAGMRILYVPFTEEIVKSCGCFPIP